MPDHSRKDHRIMDSKTPSRKTSAAGVGGALAVVLMAVIPGTESPELAAAIATICAFALAYVIPEG